MRQTLLVGFVRECGLASAELEQAAAAAFHERLLVLCMGAHTERLRSAVTQKDTTVLALEHHLDSNLSNVAHACCLCTSSGCLCWQRIPAHRARLLLHRNSSRRNDGSN